MLGVIIQARMGSARLPGKILMPVGDKLLLDHILGRLTGLKHPVMIVVATSDSEADNVVEEHCRNKKILLFRGDEKDVLERYYSCASQYKLDPVVRLTGDNPFVDIEELDRLIDLFIQDKLDYAQSFSKLPVGVGAEIFSFKTLKKCYLEGKEPHHREHVNEYIIENKEAFRCGVLKVPDSKNHPEVRLTIDTLEDYKRACYVADKANGQYINTELAVRLCSQFA